MKAFITSVLKALKNNVRAVAFLLLVVILLEIWICWLKPKHYDGNLIMESFYAQPENSIDMLVIGSSHTFVDVNTGTLWDEFGIPSFVIGGSLQPFWNSYYYLKEAVKTQTPRLVVLEALACNIDDDYSNPGVVFNNTYGMHWNMNKIESIRASVCNTDGLIDTSLFFEDYHNRYNELSICDVAGDLGDSVRTEVTKGFYDYLLTDYFAEPDYDPDTDPVPITNKEEYYFRLIIEFCQENDLPLLIVVSPDAGYNNISRARYLYAAEIADEYGVEFIDYNEYYDEIDIDFSEDFADIGHLNHTGNRKFTRYLGEYIVDNYDMADRRYDNTGIYESWDENYTYLQSCLDNYLLRETFDTVEYYGRLSELSDDYEVFVTVSNLMFITDETRAYLGINGISSVRSFDSRRYRICGGSTLSMTADDNGLFYEEYAGNHHLVICTSGIFYDSRSILVPDHDGIVIVTFDTYNQVVADSVTIVGNEVWRFDV